ncbi:hypothetical protein, partial [Feifania hominis]
GFAVGGPAAANVIFSSKNAAQTAHEIAGRGGTPEQVLLGASTGFLVETITNAIPFGQLGKLTDAASQLEFQGMLGGILKQAGLSFTSTSAASAMERFADDQIMGEKSYVSQMEQELRKQGYSAEEARDRAALWNHIALPAMNGTLGAMGSVATSIGLITIAGLRGKYAQTIALDDQYGQIQQNQNLQDQSPQDPQDQQGQNHLALNPGDGIMNGESSRKANKIPNNNSTTGHIFRDAVGHIPDTPENRALLEDVANNAENFRGTDKYGNEWYTKTLENGKEVWVESRNGNIFEGGINETSKPWNPYTGLKEQ